MIIFLREQQSNKSVLQKKKTKTNFLKFYYLNLSLLSKSIMDAGVDSFGTGSSLKKARAFKCLQKE